MVFIAFILGSKFKLTDSLTDSFIYSFDPIFTDKTQSTGEGYNYLKSVANAYKAGTLQDDIKKEQAKVLKADLIIFQVMFISLLLM